MGHDIHLHVEYRHQLHGDRWLHYAQLRPKRNYEIFEYLADPRDETDGNSPLLPARGLLDDMSPETRINVLVRSPPLTPSWISSDEIVELAKFVEKYVPDRNIAYLNDWVGYFFGCGFEDRFDWKRHGVTDLRFVFWFDA